MRFGRTTSALDQLADALRRADATWEGRELYEWELISDSDREQWRTMARRAATVVVAEIAADGEGGIRTHEAV
jgi:hypothetical protein